MVGATSSGQYDARSLRRVDPTIADLDDIYLDGTLVLVAGHADRQRDPTDPVDVHQAVVEPGEQTPQLAGTGPAWRADSLYTGGLFDAKRAFARAVTQWARSHDGSAWGVLSAEHGVLMPWTPATPYETTLDDYGDDVTDPDEWAETGLDRRPDGQGIVTELDVWASMVAYDLGKWIANYRELGVPEGPDPYDADTLLVVADEAFTRPLRERGVFEYCSDRMAGDPNQGCGAGGTPEFPLRVRFLFADIAAESRAERTAWVSDAAARLGRPRSATDQHALGAWSGDQRACQQCGGTLPGVALDEYDGAVYCAECAPDRCARCDEWTHAVGLGSYPLCENCQTQGGGQKQTPVKRGDDSEQMRLFGVSR